MLALPFPSASPAAATCSKRSRSDVAVGKADSAHTCKRRRVRFAHTSEVIGFAHANSEYDRSKIDYHNSHYTPPRIPAESCHDEYEYSSSSDEDEDDEDPWVVCLNSLPGISSLDVNIDIDAELRALEERNAASCASLLGCDDSSLIESILVVERPVITTAT